MLTSHPRLASLVGTAGLAFVLATAIRPLPAQANDDVLANLPADSAGLLVVRDVMPHVDAMLASPAVRHLLRESGDLQRELFGMQFDAVSLRRQIGLVRDMVPTEIVVAVGQNAFVSLAQASAVVLATAVCQTEQSPDEGLGAVQATMRERANEALTAFTAPDVVAWIRVRDERMAERWFDDLAAMAEDLAAYGIEMVVDGASLTVRVHLLTAFDAELKRGLQRLGIDVPEAADPLLEARLVQRGAQLEVRLGAPAAGPLQAERLPSWRDDERQLWFSHFDVGGAGERMTQLCADLDAAAAVIWNTELSLRLTGVSEQLSWLQTPTTTSARVDDGFLWTMEATLDGDPASELDAPDPDVVRCVAPADGPFLLSALPLDVLLAVSFDQVATRLAGRGRPMPEAFLPLLEFLDGEASAVFEPGCLFTSRAAGLRAATEPELGAMPFAAVALVAKATDDDAAAGFVRDLTATLQEGTGIVGEWWLETDLGLGVPTRSLDLAQLVPAYATAGVDADFVPHWCVQEGVWILSTDAKLTADVLARLRGATTPELPARMLVDWTRCSGQQASDAWAAAARWWRALSDSALLPQGSSFRHMDAVLDALALLTQAVDAYESVSELDGQVFREVTRLRLLSGK